MCTINVNINTTGTSGTFYERDMGPSGMGTSTGASIGLPWGFHGGAACPYEDISSASMGFSWEYIYIDTNTITSIAGCPFVGTTAVAPGFELTMIHTAAAVYIRGTPHMRGAISYL